MAADRTILLAHRIQLGETPVDTHIQCMPVRAIWVEQKKNCCETMKMNLYDAAALHFERLETLLLIIRTIMHKAVFVAEDFPISLYRRW